MNNLFLLIIGITILITGVENLRGDIRLIHSYNRKRVKEEDIPKYGKVVGIGNIIIGVSILIGVAISFVDENLMGYPAVVGTIIGLGFILYGQFRYNRGLF